MKGKIAFSIGICLFWISLLYLDYIVNMPYNPLTLNKSFSNSFKAFLPQGWNFFTRDPREERFYIYELDNKGVRPLKEFPYRAAYNLFGIKRDARGIGTDYGILVQYINQDEWVASKESELNSKETIEKIKSSQPLQLSYGDNSSKHFLQGRKLLVKKSFLPWSWFKDNLKTNLPLKYVYIDIKEL